MKYSQELLKHFEFEEGLRLESYLDTLGYWTIGIGHMLGKDNKYANQTITLEEAYQLLEGDIDIAYNRCTRIFEEFVSHPTNVKMALVDMSFNLGNRLAGFKRMIAAVNNRDYQTAATEAADSNWAKQVPNRARRTIAQLAG